MVFLCLLISIFSSPFTNSRWIVLSASITIGITVSFMFHFLHSLARFWYLSLFSLSFALVYRDNEVHYSASLFFFFFFFDHHSVTWPVPVHLFAFQNSLTMMCVAFPGIDSGLYIYHFFLTVNFQFFVQFPVDPILFIIINSISILREIIQKHIKRMTGALDKMKLSKNS